MKNNGVSSLCCDKSISTGCVESVSYDGFFESGNSGLNWY